MNRQRSVRKVLGRTGLLVGCALAAGLVAAAGPAQKMLSIPFADIGNILDWRANDADAVYIESSRSEWYRATFFSPCISLPFALQIAFVTEPNGALNQFSSILVEGERCWFRTFEHASGPPPAQERAR
jgi:Family of unknown function (DUF6491)